MIEVDPQQRAFETTLAAQRRHHGLEVAAVLALPQITVEDRLSIEAALAGHRNGLDLADALHRATYRSCDRMGSYDDRRLARRAADDPPARTTVPGCARRRHRRRRCCLPRRRRGRAAVARRTS